MSGKLTKKQCSLLEELRQIRDLLQLDFDNIHEAPVDSRTVSLEVMKNKLIRGQIIVWYTLIDEFLTNRICRYFFGKKRTFPQLWRTKQFQIFNYNIIESLSLLEKLRLVKAISSIPKSLAADIEQLNFLRNGIAHSFFPENLRSSKPSWKGKSVFSIDGLVHLESDISKVCKFFIHDEPWY